MRQYKGELLSAWPPRPVGGHLGRRFVDWPSVRVNPPLRPGNNPARLHPQLQGEIRFDPVIKSVADH
jgi:hypothetical protein